MKSYPEARKRSKDKTQRVRRSNQPTAHRSTTSDTAKSSILFTSVFDNEYRGQVYEDTGADSSILDSETLHCIILAGVDVEAKNFNKARIFNMAAANANEACAKLRCRKSVSVDTELHIRHGFWLHLRNFKSLVTDQSVPASLLGWPILEALALIM